MVFVFGQDVGNKLPFD